MTTFGETMHLPFFFRHTHSELCILSVSRVTYPNIFMKTIRFLVPVVVGLTYKTLDKKWNSTLPHILATNYEQLLSKRVSFMQSEENPNRN